MMPREVVNAPSLETSRGLSASRGTHKKAEEGPLKGPLKGPFPLLIRECSDRSRGKGLKREDLD